MFPRRCKKKRTHCFVRRHAFDAPIGQSADFFCVTRLGVTQCEFALRDLPDGFASHGVRGGGPYGFRIGWGVLYDTGAVVALVRETSWFEVSLRMQRAWKVAHAIYGDEFDRCNEDLFWTHPPIYYSSRPPIRKARTLFGNM